MLAPTHYIYTVLPVPSSTYPIAICANKEQICCFKASNSKLSHARTYVRYVACMRVCVRALVFPFSCSSEDRSITNRTNLAPASSEQYLHTDRSVVARARDRSIDVTASLKNVRAGVARLFRDFVFSALGKINKLTAIRVGHFAVAKNRENESE